jgi:hypothetical protein
VLRRFADNLGDRRRSPEDHRKDWLLTFDNSISLNSVKKADLADANY